MALKPKQEAIADTILSNLKEIFGWSAYDMLTRKIMRDYLNNKMDIRTAMIEHPDIFERAFIGLIGPLGEKFLANICKKMQSDLNLSQDISYSKVGGFAKYIKAVRQA
jgi:hypothetical protein